MRAMRTHSDILRDAGTVEEIATRRGVSVPTVRSWIQRDSIPSEYWADFANENCGTLEELAAAEKARAEDRVDRRRKAAA